MTADRQGGNDFRSHSPRFSGENLDRNLALVGRLREVASQLGVAVAQVAIVWVAAQGNDIVPLVGPAPVSGSKSRWAPPTSA